MNYNALDNTPEPCGSHEYCLSDRQPELTREQKIDLCVDRAKGESLPCREILLLECSDNEWRRPFGIPFGVTTTGRTTIAGYALVAKNGTTVGTMMKSKEALMEAQERRLTANQEEFRANLRGASDAELERQYDFWITQH